MRIGEIFDRVFDEQVGWRPATGSIKPVHIANGMFRALVGRRYDISRLMAFIVWWQKGRVQDPDRTFQALVTDDPDGPFRAFSDDPEFFESVRDFARAVLGADRALFPSAENSSLTLTCAEMISPDPNDHGMGAFAAALIGGADNEAPLAEAVRRALRADDFDDPLSTLAWPLLDDTGREMGARHTAAVDRLNVVAPAYFKALQDAAGCLATHEAQQGNRLRTLERAVHFACLSAQSHVQALVAGGDLDRRPPGLVAIQSPKNSPLTLASEMSVAIIHDRFEAWLREQLAERLAAGEPLHQSEALPTKALAASAKRSSLEDIVRAIGAAKRNAEVSVGHMTARLEDLQEGLRYFPDPADKAKALAHALWSIYRREFTSGGPREYLLRIGRWSGLIYPHFQGASREKRLRPSLAMLDMLARSCVAAGDSVPLDDFLDRLWLRFGLIVGGRGDGETDATFLRRFGIDLDASQLVANTEDLVDQLSALGLARRYADNITFVGDGHVG